MVQVLPDETLLDVVRRAGGRIDAFCGGAGVCGKCAVDVQRLGGAWQRVLACQTLPEEGMRVRLPDAGGGLRVDADSAADAAGRGRFERDASQPGELGVAVDLGTTTIAAYLFDLSTGSLLGRTGAPNPQAPFGADVISRIHASTQGKLAEMQGAAASCMRQLAQSLCQDAGVDADRVQRWAVAGNTVMEHILCGVSPESIGAFPFEPQTLFGDARAVAGIGEDVRMGPCVSGYVGGDITAGIVACGLDAFVDLDSEAPEGKSGAAHGKADAASQGKAVTAQEEAGAAQRPARRTVLFADLGTNGEMALVANGRLYACATATGPAFEGANIEQGMQARDGAIDSCAFSDGRFSVTTVGGAPARGVCGSGLIDALAACLQAGIVDETGRLLRPDELPQDRAGLVEVRDAGPAALLVPDGSVALTQKDVRALQLAKAAVAAGIETLLAAAGVAADEVDEFVIGGAFGAHMRAEAAARIGLFPAQLLPRVRMVGNCAGAGACMALLSQSAMRRMQVVAQAARYIELSTDAGFSEAYIDAMEFEEALS